MKWQNESDLSSPVCGVCVRNVPLISKPTLRKSINLIWMNYVNSNS